MRRVSTWDEKLTKNKEYNLCNTGNVSIADEIGQLGDTKVNAKVNIIRYWGRQEMVMKCLFIFQHTYPSGRKDLFELYRDGNFSSKKNENLSQNAPLGWVTGVKIRVLGWIHCHHVQNWWWQCKKQTTTWATKSKGTTRKRDFRVLDSFVGRHEPDQWRLRSSWMKNKMIYCNRKHIKGDFD